MQSSPEPILIVDLSFKESNQGVDAKTTDNNNEKRSRE